MDADRCGFDGNSDLYGLGIRVGVYTQLLSTLITGHFLPSDVAGTSTANLIFLCALILAVVRSIAANTEFIAVECFVILQLILTFFFASTAGLFFVLAEWGTAFLDGHIPVLVLKRLASKETRDGIQLSRYLSKLGQAYTDQTPLRASVQKSLGLAASIINFWFWVAGVRALRHDAEGCRTYVFFFTPVVVTTPIRAVFILLSSLYLSRHSLTFLITMGPSTGGTWKDWVQETFDPRSKSERRLQKTPDSASEEAFEKAKQSTRSAISAKLLTAVHTVLFTWSSCVICYSILAVELTLAWNNVEGVYEVSSTGQFVPLLIGILGLGRALVSAFIARSGPSRRTGIDKSTMKREEESAKFQYFVGRRRKIVFDASPPPRRHSLSDLNSGQAAPNVQKFSRNNPLAPVLPIRPSQEDLRLDAPRVVWSSARFTCADRKGGYHTFHDHRPARRMSWDGATKLEIVSGQPHRARQALWTPLKKREEVEAAERKREQWFESEKKSLQRLDTTAPSRREKKRLALTSATWKRFREGVEDDNPVVSSYEESNPVWLPPDVDDERLFCTRPAPQRRTSWSSRSTSRSTSPARSASGHLGRTSLSVNSTGSQYSVHTAPSERPASFYSPYGGQTFGGSAPCVLVGGQDKEDDDDDDDDDDTVPFASEISADRNSLYVADSRRSESSMYYVRRRSRSLSPDSQRSRPSSATRSEPVRLSPMRKVIYWILLPIVTIFNAVCLCGICVAFGKGIRKVKKSAQNKRRRRQIQQRQPQVAPTLRKSMLYQCPICDQNFEQERRTRQWQVIHSTTADSRSQSPRNWFRSGYDQVMDLIGPDYTKKFFLALVRGVFALLSRSKTGKELERAVKARMVAYEIEMEEVAVGTGKDGASIV